MQIKMPLSHNETPHAQNEMKNGSWAESKGRSWCITGENAWIPIKTGQNQEGSSPQGWRWPLSLELFEQPFNFQLCFTSPVLFPLPFIILILEALH